MRSAQRRTLASWTCQLIAGILLLVPGTAAFGALLALGVISGALVSHLTKLGIVVQDDGGLLFVLALIVFACSASVLYLRRESIPVLGPRLRHHVRSATA